MFLISRSCLLPECYYCFWFFFRIPLNVRDIVYCTGVSLMDEDVWEFIWMKFHSTTAVSEKKILLEALTCSDDRNLLNRYKYNIYLHLLPIITSTFMDHHLSFGLNERTLLFKHRVIVCLNCLMFVH